MRRSAVLGTLAALCLRFAEPSRFLAAAAGFAAFDTTGGTFRLLPTGADWFLIGAFAAYSGCGGVTNITLSNWARDQGYGMGQVVGYIPTLVGGQQVRLAHTGASSRLTRARSPAGAAGGASCARTSGASSSPGRCWAWRCCWRWSASGSS